MFSGTLCFCPRRHTPTPPAFSGHPGDPQRQLIDIRTIKRRCKEPIRVRLGPHTGGRLEGSTRCGIRVQGALWYFTSYAATVSSRRVGANFTTEPSYESYQRLDAVQLLIPASCPSGRFSPPKRPGPKQDSYRILRTLVVFLSMFARTQRRTGRHTIFYTTHLLPILFVLFAAVVL